MGLTSDARDIGRLLSYALRPRVRPGAGGDYGALVARYRDEVEFRDAVDALLDGMDVTVSHAGDLGLYLTPRRESIFAYRISSESTTWTNDRARALRGIAHLGIAAWVYPRPEDLEDPAIRYIDVMRVVPFLRHAVAGLRERAETIGTPGSTIATVAELEEAAGLHTAWSHWEPLPDKEVSTTGRGSGRVSSNSTTYWVLRAARELVDFGLAKPIGKDGEGRFQVLERFRIQVGRHAMDEGYRALAALRRSASTTPDPRDPGPPITLPGGVPAWAENAAEDAFPAAAAAATELPDYEEEQQ